MGDTLVQLVPLQMARNLMVDTQVLSVWLQIVRNPMGDTQVQLVPLQMARNLMVDTQEPHGGHPGALGAAADG